MSFVSKLDRHLRLWVTSMIFELRRTRRVIVQPEQRERGQPPIFLCGVHRSGTTLLRLIFDSHSRIACPPESFFIGPLADLLRDTKAMEGLAAMGFDRAHVLARLRETAEYFFEMYASSRQKPRWADKTPSYVDCLDPIDELFGPEARYVVIYRHGLDAACSIATIELRELEEYRGAPREQRLVAAARYWATQCRKLRDFQARHPERTLELRYESLCANPEPELRRVFEFVDEAFEPQLLRFYEQPHDHWVGLQDSKAAESTGFDARSETWRDEPPELVRAMLDEVRPMLDTLGYSTDTAS
jgi:hypothetical protein